MIVTQEQLFEIAREAAPRIDGAWRFNRIRSQAIQAWSPTAVITDDTESGREIRIRRSWRNQHRLALWGVLASLGAHPYSSKQITVNPQRGGWAIAGDINRRLLPSYLDDWEQRKGDLAKAQAKREEFLHKLHLIRTFCPDLRAVNGDDARSDRFYWRGPAQATGSLRLYPGYDRVGIEISLRFADALRVLALLNNDGRESGEG